MAPSLESFVSRTISKTRSRPSKPHALRVSTATGQNCFCLRNGTIFCTFARFCHFCELAGFWWGVGNVWCCGNVWTRVVINKYSNKYLLYCIERLKRKGFCLKLIRYILNLIGTADWGFVTFIQGTKFTFPCTAKCILLFLLKQSV